MLRRLGLPLALSFAVFAFAQNPTPVGSTPVSDPQALTLVAQSIAALTGGTPVNDVTLTGNVTWLAGSDNQIGSATLVAKGTAESRIDLALSAATRTEIRNDTGAFPQGASAINGGALQPRALHNCWIDPSWFFPALSYLNAASDPTLVFSYVGQETHRGLSVQHLRIFRYLGTQSATQIALVQRLSALDVYLDSSALLPVAFVFTTHPEDDANTDIRLEIIFSKYLAVNGVQVPSRIQRLVQNGLAVDVSITGATLNSGVPDSLFAVQ